MRGMIQPDHIPRNKYRLRIRGMPEITFVSVGSLEEELEKVALPDRTNASGGNTKPIEFAARMPTHHETERRAMENWYADCQDDVAPDYKKIGTLIKKTLTGMKQVSYTLTGLFITKRGTSDLEMENEGEEDEIEWTFSSDKPIPR